MLLLIILIVLITLCRRLKRGKPNNDISVFMSNSSTIIRLANYFFYITLLCSSFLLYFQWKQWSKFLDIFSWTFNFIKVHLIKRILFQYSMTHCNIQLLLNLGYQCQIFCTDYCRVSESYDPMRTQSVRTTNHNNSNTLWSDTVPGQTRFDPDQTLQLRGKCIRQVI